MQLDKNTVLWASTKTDLVPIKTTQTWPHLRITLDKATGLERPDGRSHMLPLQEEIDIMQRTQHRIAEECRAQCTPFQQDDWLILLQTSNNVQQLLVEGQTRGNR